MGGRGIDWGGCGSILGAVKGGLYPGKDTQKRDIPLLKLKGFVMGHFQTVSTGGVVLPLILLLTETAMAQPIPSTEANIKSG